MAIVVDTATLDGQGEGQIEGLEVRLLGPVAVVRAGRPVRTPGAKPTALLAMLAIHAGEVVGTDRLIDALWGAEPPPTAAAVLRTYVAQLRRVLASGVIETGADAYSLRAEAVRIDAWEFEAQITQAQAAPPGRADLKSAALRRALAMWHGPALGALASEGFAVAEAQRLEELRWATIEDRIDSDLECGHHTRLVAELQLLIAEQPLRDRLRGQVIVALYRSGRQAEALDAFQDYRRLLTEELGIEPSPELNRLEHAVLVQDSSLAPPPQTTGAALGRRHNLPEALSSFVGRDDETEQIGGLLRGHRLVTLVGPGGCGKTRLAIEVGARQLDDHSDGVWLVELAAVTQPAQVPSTLGAVWGLQDAGTGAVATRVVEYLASRELVLIVDNCEHLIASVADLVNDILHCAPLMRVLATSREPLGVAGEVTVRVPSLGLPREGSLRPDEANAADAVRLFVDRAAQARPGFALTAANTAAVVEICRRLDGIPLALELAAARVRALAPGEIAERLNQRFTLLTGGPRTALPRHRTLRSLIDWSWELLSDPERRLLRRLAVFAGGFTLDAAQSVCAAEHSSSEDLLGILSALIEKSLLVAEWTDETSRYTMLETIRQYALDQLAQAGEETSFRDRHLSWVVALHAQAESGLFGPEQEAWTRTCETELANARAALAWAQATGQHDAGLGIAAVQRLWQHLGQLTEGRTWLELLLATPASDQSLRAHAFNVAGYLAYLQGDLAQARSHLEQGIGENLRLRRPDDVLYALGSLSQVALAEGHQDEARRYLTSAPEWARLADHRSERARTTSMLSRFAIADGEMERATTLANESLADYKKLGDRHGMASPLRHLGELAYRVGDFRAARRHLEEALQLIRGICKVCTENVLSDLAEVISAQGGDTIDTASLLHERDRLRVELGLRTTNPWIR
jgi:predicted ATPase/DNA-binding SARP family transcriptional activator